jgi:hypothetical protein
VERGWSVTVVAQEAAHLPAEETKSNGVHVRRPPVDRRVIEALRPVPGWARRAVGRLLGLAPDAIILPPRGGGLLGRIRGPIRRGLEILAYRRRIGPWSEAVLSAAPDTRIFAAKALVALPVIATAAAARRGAYAYDVADLHVESGRLAHLPRPIKSYLRRREGRWLREAGALTAATPALADEVARRYHARRPTVVLNVRARWRPDDPTPTSTRLREAAGIADDRPILLYQGAFRVEQGIEELLPALVYVPLPLLVEGVYDSTPDHQAILGRVRENVWVAAGFSGHGFMLAPVVGRILADAILEDREDEALHVLDAGRFAENRLVPEPQIV